MACCLNHCLKSRKVSRTFVLWLKQCWKLKNNLTINDKYWKLMKIVSRPSVVVVRRPSSSSSVMSCVRLSSVPASSSSSVCPSRPSVVVRSKINCFYKQNVILDQQMLIFHWFYKVFQTCGYVFYHIHDGRNPCISIGKALFWGTSDGVKSTPQNHKYL